MIERGEEWVGGKEGVDEGVGGVADEEGAEEGEDEGADGGGVGVEVVEVGQEGLERDDQCRYTGLKAD